MKILVLRSDGNSLHYSFFTANQRWAPLMGTLEEYRGSQNEEDALLMVLEEIRNVGLRAGRPIEPDAVAIQLITGGTEFRGPTLVSSRTMERMRALAPHAPLHLPSSLVLTECCRRVFFGAPIIWVFGTSFFTDLPAREYLYGLDPQLVESMKLRRFGFNGIYHESACHWVRLRMRERQGRGALKILSICLEPRPEIAAVIGNHAVMVTTGATPLEGIPGQTSCGEIDPSIVLDFSQKLGWGPEKINTTLTRQSGLQGLVGEPVLLGEALTSTDPKFELPRDILQYHILQACGAGLAAMGGLDAVVFSGRYADAGNHLGIWLNERLSFVKQNQSQGVEWICYSERIDRLVADQAMATLLAPGGEVAA